VSISKRPKRRGAKGAAHVIVTTGIRRVATISIALNTKLTAAQYVDNRTQITGAMGLLVSGRYGIQHTTQLDPKIQTLVGDIIHPRTCKFMEVRETMISHHHRYQLSYSAQIAYKFRLPNQSIRDSTAVV
jgi:hypothetical protein